jgi:hypothetical protein
MMKRLVAVVLVAIVFVGGATPAFAVKGFNDQFKATYAEGEGKDAFKKLVDEAKCNVCHVQGENKKVRNEYGDAFKDLLKKENFPAKRFKDEPEKCKEEIEAAFKKVEEMKAKDGKTFGEKIKAGVLPGGDKDGK